MKKSNFANYAKKLKMRLISILLISVVSLVSCTDKFSKVDIQIISSSIEDNITVVNSEFKLIELELNIPSASADFEWSINEKIVSREPYYLFDATQNGVHKIRVKISNMAGSVYKDYNITVRKYDKGYFIVNEGSYGAVEGSVNYYIPSENKIITNAVDNSGDINLGITSSTGVVHNGILYITSKLGNNLVGVDVNTFTPIKQLSDARIGECNGFAIIDETRAVISSLNGLFAINLNTLTITTKIGDISTIAGNVFVDNGKIFAIYKDKGLVVYSASDYSLINIVGKNISLGFSKTPNGALWAASTDALFRINTSDISITEINLPAGLTLYDNWFAWRSGIITASTIENNVYMAVSQYAGEGNKIYCYKDGNQASLSSVFAQGKSDDTFYGESIKYDPKTNSILAIFIKEGWGDNSKVNRIVSFDATTGAETARFTYPEPFLWFPSAIVFEK